MAFCPAVRSRAASTAGSPLAPALPNLANARGPRHAILPLQEPNGAADVLVLHPASQLQRVPREIDRDLEGKGREGPKTSGGALHACGVAAFVHHGAVEEH